MDSGTDADLVAIEDVIEQGRLRGASSEAIAQEVATLVLDPTWRKAMSHPMRAAILDLLGDGNELSPVQASAQLDGPLATVAYHFRVLRTLGLIEICAQHSRRGAVEHVYRACARTATGSVRPSAGRSRVPS